MLSRLKEVMKWLVKFFWVREEFDYTVEVCSEERELEKIKQMELEMMKQGIGEKSGYTALELALLLIAFNRMEDVKRASEDKEYLEMLLEELGLRL